MGSPRGSVHLEEEGLDEAADDEAVDLEAAEPPAADRGPCPHSDHPRGITSEVVQLARGSNPSQPCISGPHGVPPADATRGRREADDDARYRRERARLLEGWLGRV